MLISKTFAKHSERSHQNFEYDSYANWKSRFHFFLDHLEHVGHRDKRASGLVEAGAGAGAKAGNMGK